MEKVICRITCPSNEVLLEKILGLKNNANLDQVFTRTNWIYPGETKEYRLGDYFTAIEVSDIEDLSFKLNFHIRNGMNSDWKWMLMRILRYIAINGTSVSILR